MTTLPPAIESQIRGHLAPEEPIVWWGQPLPAPMRMSGRWAWSLAAMIGMLGTSATFAVVRGSNTGSIPLPPLVKRILASAPGDVAVIIERSYILVFALAIWGFALLIAVAGLSRGRVARSTWYVVTDRRILSWVDEGDIPLVKSVEAAQLRDVELVETGRGAKTLRVHASETLPEHVPELTYLADAEGALSAARRLVPPV